MALIGQNSVLSTALPRNKNFPHTCWMIFLVFLSTGGDKDVCMHIDFWLHRLLVHLDVVYVGSFVCVGIGVTHIWHSLAFRGVLVVVQSSVILIYRLPVQSFVTL